MFRAQRLLAATFISLLLVLPTAAAVADDRLAGPHAFDDGIQALRAKLESGECKGAVAELKALLAQHEEKDYVKARRAEIVELTRSLACAAKSPLPQMKDLLGGKVQKWSAETGKLQITYTLDTSAALVKQGEFLRFPARLVGPFKLEIKGRRYPRSSETTPQIHCAGPPHPETRTPRMLKVELGLPEKRARGSSRVKATIVHVDGKAERTLSERSAPPGKVTKPYKIVLKFTKSKISIAFASRSFGSAKLPEGTFGDIAFRAGGWTEVKLAGAVDSSFFTERLAEVRRARLHDFDKDYDASAVLPEWLFDSLERDRSRRGRRAVDLMAQLSSAHYDLVLEVGNEIREEEFETALRRIKAIQAEGVGEATCELLRAQAYSGMNQLENALVHIRRCNELEPDFLDGFLMQGSLLRQLGKYDEALKVFEHATGAHARDASAFEEAAQAMLMAGRPADAKRMTRIAARNGVYSKALITLNDALQKVVNGPHWRKRYEHKSQNYHVLSDMDVATCREAATLLEEAFDAFRKKIHWVEDDRTRLFKVYIFSDRKGFMHYQGQLEEFMGKPTEMAAGLYSPLLKQLLIWDHANRREMLNTVRHEGFHQYFDRVLPNPPRWLDEGLACYYENGKKIDGTLEFGQMHPGFVRLLLSKGLTPLKEFLYISASQFYDNGHHSYGQAWALVHMLQHTTPQYLALFKGMMEDLKTESGFAVLRKRFPPEVIAKLDKDLRDYVMKLPKR